MCAILVSVCVWSLALFCAFFLLIIFIVLFAVLLCGTDDPRTTFSCLNCCPIRVMVISDANVMERLLGECEQRAAIEAVHISTLHSLLTVRSGPDQIKYLSTCILHSTIIYTHMAVSRAEHMSAASL